MKGEFKKKEVVRFDINKHNTSWIKSTLRYKGPQPNDVVVMQ